MKSHGEIFLTAASPAQTFEEPLTLAEVKAYLNIPERSPTDSEEDAMLETFIIAARELAEVAQGRDLIRKQWDLCLDDFPAEIELRQPLVTVDLIRYRDSTGAYTSLTENTDYIVDTARGLVMPVYGGSWPSFTAWPSSPILVRFTSGYADGDIYWSDAGQRVLQGMKCLISHWHFNRLPFEASLAINEYPNTVTALLGTGARMRVR